MRFGILQFPGSNCDLDAYHALRDELSQEAEYVWHQETSVAGFDCLVVPGGFSYGDYLRTGAVARFSPVMAAVTEFARAGGLVIGICNGFQILCEAHLLPGALVRNVGQRFVCRPVELVVENAETPFTRACAPGARLSIPVAHGEGCYIADEATLDELERSGRVLFRYAPGGNPNGSARDIAGIANESFNVLGMMPHPERACSPLLGSADGLCIWQSILATLAERTPLAASSS